MFFDMKSAVLYGLVAAAYASPIPGSSAVTDSLIKRAKLGDFTCPDGSTVQREDVRNALNECREHDDRTVAGSYPKYFGNQSGNQKVFTNIPDGTRLREFPIIANGVYTTGNPGAYRVVTDYKDNRGDFRGVMVHIGPTVGGAYQACTLAKDKREEKRGDDDDTDKEDRKKHKGGKDGDDDDDDDNDSADDELAVRDTSASSGSEMNELATRAKKKKIVSATCPDGTTLAKDDVGAAWKELKDNSNGAYGKYPENFGNMSGGSQVYPGVTKQLRSFPIIPGGVFQGNQSPGKYRVVGGEDNKFQGVMIEGAGGTFQQCTLNDE
ncbi:conserved hypothetical protein [Paecilomyces variotii No. 5]|uniref:Uncharacterized protein n=1 Tax=Byssochlamys spectabilis (strain No. 5 / NBRC 109023) TaxID=1356009 RepID=V5FZM0_BYSSN|nr:conserved hypothetical protein [Paecilomyces variotii No. 5]